MGLYDSSYYPDLLRNLQTYSSQRRSATGRGLTPGEIRSATEGYQNAENARKMDMYKTTINAANQARMHNQSAVMQQRQLDQEQNIANAQGLMSIPKMGMEGYALYKYLTKPDSSPLLGTEKQFNSPNNSVSYNPNTPYEGGVNEAVPSATLTNSGDVSYPGAPYLSAIYPEESQPLTGTGLLAALGAGDEAQGATALGPEVTGLSGVPYESTGLLSNGADYTSSAYDTYDLASSGVDYATPAVDTISSVLSSISPYIKAAKTGYDMYNSIGQDEPANSTPLSAWQDVWNLARYGRGPWDEGGWIDNWSNGDFTF